MKVALVLERFDWRKGGLESWTWQFAQLLKNKGIEVHIVAFEFHPSANELGIIAHRPDGIPRSRLQRAEALERCLRSLQVDVIHDMGAGFYADVFHPHGGSTIATWRHNLMRVPRWRRFTFWRPARHRGMLEIERRQHANNGSIVVAVSHMVESHLRTLHQVPAGRVRVIYNGVDLEKFSPAHRAEFRQTVRAQLGLKNEVLFFLLAHNLKLKNASTLIRAMGVLATKNKPAHLVIAGSGKNGAFVRQAVKERAAARVTFLGLVDPVQYYAAADVAVLPTWYDPCSLFTLEAWAAGLPVITTRCNGASELMRQGVHGFALDDPADPVALAEKMELLLDEDTRAKMSHAARELALAHSFEKQADDFIALYREIMDGKQ
jgi:UDP-glucose:(heptosyl)LPS alpha-1,3-glucosyltransferase